MKRLLRRPSEDQSGTAALEYCLMAGILSVGILIGIPFIRDAVEHSFTSAGDGLQTTDR